MSEPNEPTPPTMVAIAEALGISRQGAYDWKGEGMPVTSIEAALTWQAKHKAADSPIHEQLNLARLRKLNADSEAKELETRVRKGELIDRQAVERWLSSFVNACRQTIEGWPAYVVAEVPGEIRTVAHDILTEQVRLLLIMLSQMPAELFADETINGDSIQAVESSEAESAGV